MSTSTEEATVHRRVEPVRKTTSVAIALLTGGDDRPYALGMAGALHGECIFTDFLGSDALDAPLLHESPYIRFLNMRGNQSESASYLRKSVRIALYYLRLFTYAATARPRVFHILWNNKYAFLDRVVLMAWYRLLGRRIVLTAHNVNAARRDGHDSIWNRATLRFQYRLCDHVLVHTARMRDELVTDFGVSVERTTVIPFGLNDSIPHTALTREAARAHLGLEIGEKVILFFGQIAPYKGLQYLVAAMPELAADGIRLVIAGKVKRGCEDYWAGIESALADPRVKGRVHRHIRFIPDEQVEPFLKAADAMILPYVDIFQSGVPFLSYSFGLPVIATDVGSLRDDVVEGETGFLCPARQPGELAATIRRYFTSPLYAELEERRSGIRASAKLQNSWTTVGRVIRSVYRELI